MNIFRTMCLQRCSKICFFSNDGDAKPDFVIFKLLLRPSDLSHRVESQKLMVTSWEEAAVRPENGLHIEGAS